MNNLFNMKSKVLVYEDRNSATNFEKSVIDTMNDSNQLIELYESFQDFQKIKQLSQWIELVTDPGGYYDKTIFNGLDLKGSKLPDAGMIAKMYNLDRENYLNATTGKTLTTDCVPCKKLKLKRGRTAISLSGYRSDKDYLIFDSGRFYLNTDAIEKHKLSFNTYLENERQSEYYTHCKRLAEILNQEIAISKLGPVQVQELAKIFGLQILDGRLILNDRKINDKIKML